MEHNSKTNVTSEKNDFMMDFMNFYLKMYNTIGHNEIIYIINWS